MNNPMSVTVLDEIDQVVRAVAARYELVVAYQERSFNEDGCYLTLSVKKPSATSHGVV